MKTNSSPIRKHLACSASQSIHVSEIQPKGCLTSSPIQPSMPRETTEHLTPYWPSLHLYGTPRSSRYQTSVLSTVYEQLSQSPAARVTSCYARVRHDAFRCNLDTNVYTPPLSQRPLLLTNFANFSRLNPFRTAVPFGDE